jgi:hypothetical protein
MLFDPITEVEIIDGYSSTVYVNTAGSDLEFAWSLDGPGNLMGHITSPVITYEAPSGVEEDGSIAVVSVRVWDGKGQEVKKNVTYRVKSLPTLTPTNTSTQEPASTSTPIPTNTSTREPISTSTPVLTNTSTREPKSTSTPIPTDTPIPTPNAAHPVYVGAKLTDGYDMGVDTSGGLTNWVTDMNGYMRMDYPSDQSWGAVFITVGSPTDPPRPGRDLSGYQSLSLELRGEVGGEYVWIGLKDNTDRDNGSETKIRVSDLTTDWQTVTFSLSDFVTADLTRLYVVIEFVFEPGTLAETIYFRRIQYLPQSFE